MRSAIGTGTTDTSRTLRVWHLGFWMLFSCIFPFHFQADEELDGTEEPGLRLLLLSYGIIAGAEITASIELVFARARRERPFLEHPGHWLVLGSAILWVVDFLPPDVIFEEPFWLWPAFTVLACCPAAFCVKASRWRFLFVALAFLSIRNRVLRTITVRTAIWQFVRPLVEVAVFFSSMDDRNTFHFGSFDIAP